MVVWQVVTATYVVCSCSSLSENPQSEKVRTAKLPSSPRQNTACSALQRIQQGAHVAPKVPLKNCSQKCLNELCKELPELLFYNAKNFLKKLIELN